MKKAGYIKLCKICHKKKSLNKYDVNMKYGDHRETICKDCLGKIKEPLKKK